MSVTLPSLARIRLWVVLVGVLLPYLARLPRGTDWLLQYFPAQGTLAAVLLMAGFNAVAWGAVLLLGQFYRHSVSWLFPALPGFAYLAVGHYSLDLTSNPNAPISLVMLPFFALVPIVLGWLVGYGFDRWRIRD
jgi:hypothetical protein